MNRFVRELSKRFPKSQITSTKGWYKKTITISLENPKPCCLRKATMAIPAALTPTIPVWDKHISESSKESGELCYLYRPERYILCRCEAEIIGGKITLTVRLKTIPPSFSYYNYIGGPPDDDEE